MSDRYPDSQLHPKLLWHTVTLVLIYLASRRDSDINFMLFVQPKYCRQVNRLLQKAINSKHRRERKRVFQLH